MPWLNAATMGKKEEIAENMSPRLVPVQGILVPDTEIITIMANPTPAIPEMCAPGMVVASPHPELNLLPVFIPEVETRTNHPMVRVIAPSSGTRWVIVPASDPRRVVPVGCVLPHMLAFVPAARGIVPFLL